ncbi:hypothetical protein ACSQ67_002066 [Phaseolus vulgaris]
MDGFQSHYASCSYSHDEVNRKNTKDNKMMGSYSYESPRSGGGNMAVSKSKSSWWWNEAERKRKRRVTKYKLYATEAKIKHSFKKGFRWFKIKCIKIVRNL